MDHTTGPERTNPLIGAFTGRLSASDSLLWRIERDAVLRSPIIVVGVLDASPEWDRLRATFDRATVAMPRLAQRIIESPVVGCRWAPDPAFSLDYHVRRVRAPHPGELRSVLEIAEPLASGSFDRDRALWEFLLVEGVDGGRAAFVFRMHHAITDGVGAVGLAATVLDLERDPRTHEVTPPPAPPSFLDQLTRRARSFGEDTVQAATSVVSDPLGTAASVPRTLRSIGRMLRPATRPLSPLMIERGLGRHLEVFERPLDEMSHAAHAVGGTINDVHLAAVAGGLARYHRLHGADVVDLRVTVPISVRETGDPLGGNRFAPARFAIPVGLKDPGERSRRIGALVRQWRDEPAMAFTEPLALLLSTLPASVTAKVFGSMLEAIDVDAVDVPGLDRPVYLAGAEVERLYAFAPPAGAALSVTLLSHVDTCCVGVSVDTAAVDDPGTLVECLVDAYDEMLALGDETAGAIGS